MPFAPAATMLLIAVTWLALSPSYLPAAVISFTPFSVAAFCAPTFILTKNGFVSVFVISPIVILSLPDPPPPADELEPPHEAVTAATATIEHNSELARTQRCIRDPLRSWRTT